MVVRFYTSHIPYYAETQTKAYIHTHKQQLFKIMRREGLRGVRKVYASNYALLYSCYCNTQLHETVYTPYILSYIHTQYLHKRSKWQRLLGSVWHRRTRQAHVVRKRGELYAPQLTRQLHSRMPHPHGLSVLHYIGVNFPFLPCLTTSEYAKDM